MCQVCVSWKEGKLVTARIEEQGLKREMYGIVTLVYNFFFCCIVVLVWFLLTHTHSVVLRFHSSCLWFCVFVYICPLKTVK